MGGGAMKLRDIILLFILYNEKCVTLLSHPIAVLFLRFKSVTRFVCTQVSR